jgi:hypothetical protein
LAIMMMECKVKLNLVPKIAFLVAPWLYVIYALALKFQL